VTLMSSVLVYEFAASRSIKIRRYWLGD